LEIRGEDFPRKKHVLQTKGSPVTVKPRLFVLSLFLRLEVKNWNWNWNNQNKIAIPAFIKELGKHIQKIQ